MRIISFAWTSAALVMGRKTVTRRDWKPEYGARFKLREVVKAYDRQPRYQGKHIANILLVQKPVQEPGTAMPDSDFEGEGFAFYETFPQCMPKTKREQYGDGLWLKESFEDWQAQSDLDWVVRFELLKLTSYGYDLRAAMLKKMKEESILPFRSEEEQSFIDKIEREMST